MGGWGWVGEGMWVNIMDGWGWVGMSGGEWGWVGVSGLGALFDNALDFYVT